MSLTKVFSIYFPYSKSSITLPSLNDIKLLLLQDNEEILNMLLENKVKISTEMVSTNSKKYHTALKNRLVQVK